MSPSWKLLAAALVVLAAQGVAVAGPGRGGPPSPGVVAAQLQAELGLDDATEAKIEEIVEDAVADGKALHERAESLTDELDGLKDSAPRDWKRIEKLVHEIALVRADAVLLRMKTSDRIEAVLPKDDVPAYRALRDRHASERREGHGPEGL